MYALIPWFETRPVAGAAQRPQITHRDWINYVCICSALIRLVYIQESQVSPPWLGAEINDAAGTLGIGLADKGGGPCGP